MGLAGHGSADHSRHHPLHYRRRNEGADPSIGERIEMKLGNGSLKHKKTQISYNVHLNQQQKPSQVENEH